MKINGTPQPDRHRSLGGKSTAAAGSGGAATGGGCGSHALIPDPSMTLGDTLLWSLLAVGAVGVVALAVAAAVAWRQRGER